MESGRRFVYLNARRAASGATEIKFCLQLKTHVCLFVCQARIRNVRSRHSARRYLSSALPCHSPQLIDRCRRPAALSLCGSDDLPQPCCFSLCRSTRVTRKTELKLKRQCLFPLLFAAYRTSLKQACCSAARALMRSSGSQVNIR